MYIITDGGATRNEYVDFMPIIEFAQLTLLLGFFSLLSIDYSEENPMLRRVGIIVKTAACCASIYAAYLSQTRGAWISIPILLIIAIVILGRRMHAQKKLMAFAALLALIILTVASTAMVQQRLLQAKEDVTNYSQRENLDTSVGIRLQLWKGSWLLFTEHPLVGVGREQFPEALRELELRGVITNAARIQPHSHNEILYNMATLGAFGLFAILGLYLVPAFYFLREATHPDTEVRATAGMGLILCAGFFILGLTDVMLMWGVSDNFYSMLAAILFAFILQRKQIMAGC
jgi:O-antigen ligase